MDDLNYFFQEKPKQLNSLYKKYLILAGCLFLVFPVFISIINPESSNIRIFNYLYFFSGGFFLLCGIGEFTHKFDRYIQITDKSFRYKLDNRKARILPWDHIIQIDIKDQSVLFTFKNKGLKEIYFNTFKTYDIISIKEALKEIKEIKKI